ncbi:MULTISPECIES: DUF1289 domain-containing protein [Psychromonas]|uniref:DUF1289 domain-containing protein n=1 Tax=Psychromonas TaxID=67572 RepID=UPI00040AAC4B|nr:MULTISPECIES: DUF1289 domain-containing protein [Psychromonas]MBB1273272.1 DUF1289 domain-containing protein [Psychromonas sp. SR45-3]
MQIPPSPCISNCCLNDQDICMGCFRSLDEIKEWSQASSPRKETIIISTKQRREQLQASVLR